MKVYVYTRKCVNYQSISCTRIFITLTPKYPEFDEVYGITLKQNYTKIYKVKTKSQFHFRSVYSGSVFNVTSVQWLISKHKVLEITFVLAILKIINAWRKVNCWQGEKSKQWKCVTCINSVQQLKVAVKYVLQMASEVL